MKIVKLKGGLGNQLFQYTFAKLLEKITSDVVKLDLTSFDNLSKDTIRKPRICSFNISLEVATREEISNVCFFKHGGDSLSLKYRIGIFLESTLNKKYFFEKKREYINPDSIINYEYFDGYWQCKKYLQQVKDSILKDLVPKKDLGANTIKWKKKMQNEISVFVGIRKGDYSSEKKHYGTLEPKYFETAMDLLERKLDNPVFYVFSNDISWCKERLNLSGHNVFFREKDDQTNDFEELLLMSSCKHAIISNSTYHWWGASLINNPGKIICCPSRWFFDGKHIDVYEDDWIQIEV